MKLLNIFKVAGYCAEGGYYETASGKFLNDSTYELLTEDNYNTINIADSNIITFQKKMTVIKMDGSFIESDSTLNK